VVELLLAKGAQADATNSDDTPLEYGTSGGHAAVTELLRRRNDFE
jgi:hypothetical protein